MEPVVEEETFGFLEDEPGEEELVGCEVVRRLFPFSGIGHVPPSHDECLTLSRADQAMTGRRLRLSQVEVERVQELDRGVRGMHGHV